MSEILDKVIGGGKLETMRGSNGEMAVNLGRRTAQTPDKGKIRRNSSVVAIENSESFKIFI